MSDSHHALVDDGVAPGLTDDQIGPLHDDNGHEEGRVTSVLQHLALGVRLHGAAYRGPMLLYVYREQTIGYCRPTETAREQNIVYNIV